MWAFSSSQGDGNPARTELYTFCVKKLSWGTKLCHSFRKYPCSIKRRKRYVTLHLERNPRSSRICSKLGRHLCFRKYFRRVARYCRSFIIEHMFSGVYQKKKYFKRWEQNKYLHLAFHLISLIPQQMFRED